MVRGLMGVLLTGLTALWVISAHPGPQTGGDRGAALALEAVTRASFDARHPAAAFPADWASVMGYLPAVAVGPHGTPILVKPTGECSSPTGPTRFDFDAVCKEHDLAYDVVRYAGRIGAPLASSGRQDADAMFRSELHARCVQQHVSGADGALCHTFAESFAVVVDVNSWRQGYRPPEPESRWSLLLFWAVCLGVGALALGRRHLARVAPGVSWHPAHLLPTLSHPRRWPDMLAPRTAPPAAPAPTPPLGAARQPVT